MGLYQVEGPKGAAPTEHQGSSAKGMSREFDELPLFFERHAWPIVVREHDKLSLDFFYVQPDWLWY